MFLEEQLVEAEEQRKKIRSLEDEGKEDFFNLFLLVGNQPISRIDYLGLKTKEECHEDYKNDSNKCRKMRGGRAKAICWAAIAAKLGACIACADDK